MKNALTLSGLIGLVVFNGTSNLAAQPLAERHNPALDRLRAGIWMERGGFDSFEPVGGGPSEPAAVDARKGDHRLRTVAWEMSLPTMLTLTPTPTPTPAPVPHEAPVAAEARPAQSVARAQSTPCEDLRNKARRLRSAAAQCDTDISNGASYCNVDVRFDRPSIPRSLPAEAARGYADDFKRYADSGDERACAAYGGQSSVSRGVPPAGKCLWSGTIGNLALIIGVQMSVEEGLCKGSSGELSHKSRQCLCTGVGLGGGVSNGIQVGDTLRSSTSWSFSYGPCGVTNWGGSCGFGFDVGAFRMSCMCNIESDN